MAVIYCTRCEINGKKYIGKRCRIFSNEELKKSGYIGSGTFLLRAVNKYGKDNFKTWALLHCSDEEANYKLFGIKYKFAKNVELYTLELERNSYFVRIVLLKL